MLLMKTMLYDILQSKKVNTFFHYYEKHAIIKLVITNSANFLALRKNSLI